MNVCAAPTEEEHVAWPGLTEPKFANTMRSRSFRQSTRQMLSLVRFQVREVDGLAL